MPVYRVEHRNNFFALSNSVVNDPRISYKAKGILAYLLSKPEDWKVYQKDIVKHSTDGQASVRAGINELIAYGYITRKQNRDVNGRIQEWEYIVTESPDCGFQQVDNQHVEKQEVENPDVENLTLQNTHVTKNPRNKKPTKQNNDSSRSSNSRSRADDGYYDGNSQPSDEFLKVRNSVIGLGMKFARADERKTRELIATYGFEWVLLAIERTALGTSEARCWRYIESILKKWKLKGAPDAEGRREETMRSIMERIKQKNAV